MMKQRRSIVVGALRESHLAGLTGLLAACILVSCVPLSAQDSSEIFSDGRTPPSLDAIANPAPNPAAVRASVAQAAAGPTVTVAVIDEGVDYLHPAVASRIKYTTDASGNAVGAGRDFFGNDAWAHPNLIVSSTFAFGATIAADGRITNPLADPLAKLVELNSIFMTELTRKLKSSSGLFNKINEKSFHLFGAKALIADKARLLAAHKLVSDQGKLLRRKNLAGQANQKVTAAYPGVVRLLLEDDWLLDADTSGFPRGVGADMMTTMDGFKDFIETVEEVYQGFDAEQQFEARYFGPYVQYRRTEFESGDFSRTIETLTKSFSDELYQRWFKVAFNYVGEDPAYAAAYNFCMMLKDDQAKRMRGTKSDGDSERDALVASIMDEVYADVDRVARQQIAVKQASEKDASGELRLTRMREILPAYKEWVTRALRDRGSSLFSCDLKGMLNRTYKYADEYGAYARSSAHPYLFDDSSSKSHGTHVSGIVLAQEPSARVLPIRVFLGSRATTTAVNRALSAKVLGDFERWLRRPEIAKAVLTRFGEDTEIKAAGDDQARKVSALVTKVRSYFRVIFEQRKSDFLFYDEILEIIRYVGAQKVKIGNMSIGGEYDKVTDAAVLDPIVGFLDDTNFVLNEYFKYQLGEALYGKVDANGTLVAPAAGEPAPASNTLFVVAAGNSGGWFDGKSKMGLPCDASSPFFAGLGVKVPNNLITNVLCVGSISKKEDLSSFTNLLMTKTVPFVLAYGEAIDSALRSDDCSGINDLVARKIGLDPTFGFGENDILEVLWPDPRAYQRTGRDENGSGKTKTSEDIAKIDLQRRKWTYTRELVGALNQLAKRQSCLVGGYVPHRKQSGTSMATPGVAGQMARLVAAKLRERGIREEAAYDDAGFAPATLIRELVASGTPLGDGSRMADVAKILRGYGYYENRTGELGKAVLTNNVNLGSKDGTTSIPSMVFEP